MNSYSDPAGSGSGHGSGSGYPYGPYPAYPAHCAACPLAPHERCPSLDHASWCVNAAKERLRRDPRQHYWLGRIRELAGQYVPPPPPALPPGFPRRLPRPGPVRVGILSPSCFLGGADLWVADVLRLCDPGRVAWSGVAIRDDSTPIVPEVRAAWERHAPVAVGPEAVRALAGASDVLLAWGVFQTWGFRPEKLAPLIGNTPLLAVSHGSQRECLTPAGPLAGAGAAAVSRAALRGLPEELRAGVRVILNAVEPSRVRPTRPAAETRALLGIPAGARVAGFLGRLSPEKGYDPFLRAVGLLPRGWAGVVAGDGWRQADARRIAREAAPGRATFLGPRHDVGDVLATFDCLCMPSESEACSLAANEAWAAGVPLVSTRVGLLEEHPRLARLVANPATPEDLAAAILADHADRRGTAARVARGKEFAARELAPGRFGREWTELICSMAPARPEPATRPGGPRRSVEPAVRDAILRCEDRGSPLAPLDEERGCCGSAPEMTECRALKGKRPGRVKLSDCVACKAEALATA